MKASRILPIFLLSCCFCLPEPAAHGRVSRDESRKVTVTTVESKPATLTRRYTCTIESQHHIEVRAPVDGYLQEIPLKEGQAVKQGDLMFRFVPVLHRARLDSELAEVQIAQLERKNAKRLFDSKAVSQDELQLFDAKLAKANAKAKLAEAELEFTNVKAPFDGVIDRFPHQQDSLVLKGETLTNLYDNTAVHAYFNMPENGYLEYMADAGKGKENSAIELVLANGDKYPQGGKFGAIEAAFDRQSGTIAFRADFPNPDGLLRNGQSGALLIHHVLQDAILIPQGAAFEELNKLYVYVIDRDRVAHRSEIVVQSEIDNHYVIGKGVKKGDTIVVDGVEMVRDGEKVEYEEPESTK
jgi:membrane fusion protein (multidrug efflux system)